MKRRYFSNLLSLVLYLGLQLSVGCHGPAQDEVHPPEEKSTMLDPADFEKLRRIASLGDDVSTEEQLHDYVELRWEHFAGQDPLQHHPTRATFVEAAWAPSPENLYLALYPMDTASNLVDFDVYVSYTSSIHQDLISQGEADLQYFFPEVFDAAQFSQSMTTAELLDDHESIIEKLRSFKLPDQADWVMELEFDSAVIWSDESNVIELRAATNRGFLLLFSVDG
jgi:hypothetical protein